jgi:hypothetical protein
VLNAVPEPAWTDGALVTQSWSFGGNAERASVSAFRLQPIASLRLSPRHAVGYTGTITATAASAGPCRRG